MFIGLLLLSLQRADLFRAFFYVFCKLLGFLLCLLRFLSFTHLSQHKGKCLVSQIQAHFVKFPRQFFSLFLCLLLSLDLHAQLFLLVDGLLVCFLGGFYSLFLLLDFNSSLLTKFRLFFFTFLDGFVVECLVLLLLFLHKIFKVLDFLGLPRRQLSDVTLVLLVLLLTLRDHPV